MTTLKHGTSTHSRRSLNTSSPYGLIFLRDKVISQPKMSARIANIIVVRCTIQYSDIAVSS